MYQTVTTALIAGIIALATSSSSFGQLQHQEQVQIQTQTQTGPVGAAIGPQQRVAPTVMPLPQPQQNPFYFGMHVQLMRGYYGGTTLRITSVDYGSPAWRAGLEIGDEIRTVNGRGFARARDSFEAVSMMNRAVSFAGGTAPAAAAGVAASAPAQAYTVAYPMPRPQPLARMVVRNVRNGRNVLVNVTPREKFIGAPGPAPAAAATVGAIASPAASAYSRQIQPRK